MCRVLQEEMGRVENGRVVDCYRGADRFGGLALLPALAAAPVHGRRGVHDLRRYLFAFLCQRGGHAGQFGSTGCPAPGTRPARHGHRPPNAVPQTRTRGFKPNRPPALMQQALAAIKIILPRGSQKAPSPSLPQQKAAPVSKQGCEGCLGGFVEHLEQCLGCTRRAALALFPIADGVQ